MCSSNSCIFHITLCNRVFAENGGMEMLLPLFADSQAICRRYGAECIVSISGDGELK